MPRKKLDGALSAPLLLSLPMDVEANTKKSMRDFTVAYNQRMSKQRSELDVDISKSIGAPWGRRYCARKYDGRLA
jgi:hypothetical protein